MEVTKKVLHLTSKQKHTMTTTAKLLPIYKTYVDANKVLGLPSLPFDKWILEGLRKISAQSAYGWTSHLKQS